MGRWVLGAALAVALACGGGEESAEQPACVPETCAAAGATCGAVPDGCGNVLQCGTCPAGQVCGGGASPNTCGPAACQPTTCAAAGATCGVLADGCGGTLACGECPGGQLCGTAGAPNTCGPAPCVKTTCAAAGATCGTLSDGCGGELACGQCGAGDVCGAAGKPNVCAPPPATGNVGWTHAVSTAGSDVPVGAGEDRAGNRYLLTFTPNEIGATHTLRLQRLDRTGKVAYTKEWAASGYKYWGTSQFHLAVTAAGDVYVAVSAECWPGEDCTRSVDFGGGALTDSALVKLAADGGFVWQRVLAGSHVHSIAANDQASVAVKLVPRADGFYRIERYRHDGVLLLSSNEWHDAFALDPAGNLVTASFGAARKYALDGRLLWAQGLPGAGYGYRAATAADGTVVVLSERVADVDFGASKVRSGSFVLYVLAADGTPRFARGLPWTGNPQLAVDPTGRAAVVGSGPCGQLAIEAFDLANADLWRRFLPDGSSCWPGMGHGPASYGQDHRLFLTGTIGQTVDVGGVTWAPRGQDALGILLDP